MKSTVPVSPELERITTIIPSLSQICPGDLIMRTNDTGETHLGVVVRTNFAGLDSSATTQDYMNSIYLISVNRSLRQVSLATWGNPAGGFGGFSLEPGKYHARRLLKKSATGELSAAGEKPGWELLDEYKVKLRSYYPPETEVPRAAYRIEPDATDLTGDEALTENDKSILQHLVSGKVKGVSTPKNYYHRELPSTSLSYRTDQPLFPGTDRVKITQLNGWRNRVVENSGVVTGHFINYHLGVDISRSRAIPTIPDADDENATTFWNTESNRAVFLAPEDGEFYLWRSVDWDTANEMPVYGSDKNKQGSLQAYRSQIYGWIGVLVTRPDDPRQGRVYLFCHMGNSGNIQEDFPYLSHYTDGTLQNATQFEAIVGQEQDPNKIFLLPVKKGERIGYVGNLGEGSTGAHIHMEVYESFIENGSNVWERVNLLSCFDHSLYTLTKTDVTGATERLDTYGWWARLVGSHGSYEEKRTEYSSGTITQKPKIDTTVADSWLADINTYAFQHSWLYFFNDNNNDLSLPFWFQDAIEEYNQNHSSVILHDDVLKEDRWDPDLYYNQ